MSLIDDIILARRCRRRRHHSLRHLDVRLDHVVAELVLLLAAQQLRT